MTAYVIRRTLLVVPTVIAVSLLIFAAVHFSPGGPAQKFCGEFCTDEQIAEIESQMGLDEPFWVQYFDWLSGVAHGDFGESLETSAPVGHELRTKLPITVELGVLGLLLSVSISIPLGVMAALRQDSIWDFGVRSVSSALLAIPNFWLALMAIALGARFELWTPALNYVDLWADPLGNLRTVMPPAVLLGMALSGLQMRLIRANMLDVLRRDYIRTATAKGLPGRVVTIRHALKNALLPSITLIGGQLGVVVGGTVILENLFNIPGMGRYLVNGVRQGDIPIILSANFVLATFVVSMNLLVDLVYTLIDPRIKAAFE